MTKGPLKLQLGGPTRGIDALLEIGILSIVALGAFGCVELSPRDAQILLICQVVILADSLASSSRRVRFAVMSLLAPSIAAVITRFMTERCRDAVVLGGDGLSAASIAASIAAGLTGWLAYRKLLRPTTEKGAPVATMLIVIPGLLIFRLALGSTITLPLSFDAGRLPTAIALLFFVAVTWMIGMLRQPMDPVPRGVSTAATAIAATGLVAGGALILVVASLSLDIDLGAQRRALASILGVFVFAAVFSATLRTPNQLHRRKLMVAAATTFVLVDASLGGRAQ